MKVESLKELTKYIHSLNPHNSIFLNKKKNRYTQLYNLLLTGIDDEDEIFIEIFDSPDHKSQYRVLKSRYLDKVIKEFLNNGFNNLNYNSIYQQINIQTTRNSALSTIMFDIGKRSIGVSIAELTLKKCIKFDLVFSGYLLANNLKLHYGVMDHNSSKFKKYNQISNNFYKQLILLNESQDLYIKFGQSITLSKEYVLNQNIRQLEKNLMVIKSRTSKVNSYYIKFYTFNAEYFLELIKNNINRQLEICEEAIKFFKTKSSFHNMGLFSFNLKKGISQMGINKNDAAIDSFAECLRLVPAKKLSNLHFLYSYMFAAEVLRKKYSAAYKIISQTINSKNFNELPTNFRAPWYLKEAFIHFLIKTGKLDPEESPDHKLRAFRLSRFKNDVSRFNKDKRGLNITINIIEFLFLLIEGKHDKMLDKLQSLKQYGYKYLKKDEYTRPFTFIKLLLQIPEGNFEPALIRKKASRYQKILEENPLDYSEHAISIEIIPYEILWEEILSSLERSTAKTV